MKPSTVPPPERCSDCGRGLVRRVHGWWCPGCAGFLHRVTIQTHDDGRVALLWRVVRPR